MEKFIVRGNNPLVGAITLAGAKNVALKTCVCSLLTDEPLTIHNVPRIKDLFLMKELLEGLGVEILFEKHTLSMSLKNMSYHVVPLSIGARLRTSMLILGPLLARIGKAKIPNPGGCRIGARPINRLIDGFIKMGADIEYNSSDGYFYAKAKQLHGAIIEFEKNTHTGTEALILASVLADGTTVLKNAAEEVEIDDLIALLNSMGADVVRTAHREITTHGVKKLSGCEYTIMGDRNEEVTLAIGAALTNGKITVEQSQHTTLGAFLDEFTRAGGVAEICDDHTVTYSRGDALTATHIETGIHPYFMTDWQAPWAVLMTQADGVSSIHETVFENRFSYVSELSKMGADIEFYQPETADRKIIYNFNRVDRQDAPMQAIRIKGPSRLHNAVVNMYDLRSGASLLLAALTAYGESNIYGVEHIDRGYEHIETRLGALGAHIVRVKEADV